ncbi:MAG TPA: glycosyltransferase [Candidatus Sphingobacterium stercorigallinarum]|nr:glycosyltransferase [Candidatus Sphingobacterium stercorigallinarum]
MSKSVLVIGAVFPEPTSSAAGWRMLSLLNFFKNDGYNVHFASASKKGMYSCDLQKANIKEHEIKLNDSSFDHLVAELNPQIVMFDRFMIEEQYSWRVEKACPDAIRILDTEDLHFLRDARSKGYQEAAPDEHLIFSEIAKRELAAILRSDLTLVISPVEYDLLKTTFGISSHILAYLPFHLDINAFRYRDMNYSSREHFCFIGNFLHAPNWKTVLELKKLWPTIKPKLPNAELHIYGAYTPEKAQQLDAPHQGFRIMGRAENAIETLHNYRVLLAPIPFGAGQKGKFIDALRAGTPSITSSIGAEGMMSDKLWPGFITDDANEFNMLAVQLYQDRALWENKSMLFEKMWTQFADPGYFERLKQRIIDILKAPEIHRRSNFIGQILWKNQFMASKYMSLWIEEKNKDKS